MNIVSKTNLSKLQMKLILGVVKRNSLFLQSKLNGKIMDFFLLI